MRCLSIQTTLQSVAVFAELLLRFGMIHLLLLAAARVMKIQTRRARV